MQLELKKGQYITVRHAASEAGWQRLGIGA